MSWKIGYLGSGAAGDEMLPAQKKVWEQVAQKLGLDLQYAEVPEEAKSDPLQGIKNLQGFHALLLSPVNAALFIQMWPKLPAEVVESGFADAALCERNHWWFRSFMREALKQAIIDTAPQLDTHSLAYVTGSGPESRLCAGVAAQLGFRKITFIARDLDEAQHLVDRLQRMFFDLDVKILRDTELTLQPNNGSLLLNCIAADSGESMLDDLPYLNFLKKDGLVVDLPYPQGLQQLIDEAKHVGVRNVDGFELCIRKDFLFLSALIGSKFTLTAQEHREMWKSVSEAKSS